MTELIPSAWRPISLHQYFVITSRLNCSVDVFGYTIVKVNGSVRRIARQEDDGTMYIDPKIAEAFLL